MQTNNNMCIPNVPRFASNAVELKLFHAFFRCNGSRHVHLNLVEIGNVGTHIINRGKQYLIGKKYDRNWVVYDIGMLKKVL